MAVFWSKIEFFGFRKTVEDPPSLFLRVLDAKEQVLEAYRSRKHSLQHAYAPKFAIFHQKKGQKCPFFGQKMSFSASDKQLKTPPPILRVLDAKGYVMWTHRASNTIYNMLNYLKGWFF